MSTIPDPYQLMADQQAGLARLAEQLGKSRGVSAREPESIAEQPILGQPPLPAAR